MSKLSHPGLIFNSGCIGGARAWKSRQNSF